MAQLTITLPDEEFQRANQAAKRVGKSIESFVKELIAKIAEDENAIDIAKDPLYKFEGFESEAPPDLSVNVDKLLYGKR